MVLKAGYTSAIKLEPPTMSPSRYSTVTEAHGSSSGALFDDAPSPDDYPSAVISAISIRHARLIDALEVSADADCAKRPAADDDC